MRTTEKDDLAETDSGGFEIGLPLLMYVGLLMATLAVFG